MAKNEKSIQQISRHVKLSESVTLETALKELSHENYRGYSNI